MSRLAGFVAVVALAGCATVPVCSQEHTALSADDDQFGPVPLRELLAITAAIAWSPRASPSEIQPPLTEPPFDLTVGMRGRPQSSRFVYVTRGFATEHLREFCGGGAEHLHVMMLALLDSSADKATVAMHTADYEARPVRVDLVRRDRWQAVGVTWLPYSWKPPPAAR